MEMKPVLVVENSLSGLVLNESASAIKSDKIILEGVFTEFDVRNRNDRIYTKDRFLPHLQDLQERKKAMGVIYGEFDHPDVFDTALSRVSHTIESINFNEKENRIDGSIRLLNTHYGKEARALVLDGFPIFVSSRAAGVTESNGTVTIKKLFTYDAVADPGFASTRMNIKVLNESLGYTNESANFRIFDMSDESKINELYEMNDNDQVTQKMMVEYSDHIKEEMVKLKAEIDENIKEGKEPEKLEALSGYYESLMENYSKLTKYLDYLAETIQTVVNENESLKEQTTKLVENGDNLAENLEKAIGYSNYLAEQIDKSIDYSEYIGENLDKSIDFAEYIAENLNKSIKYSEYLAENLDKSIDYAEYIAENTEFNISNIESLSEYVDNSVKYTEYVAEQVDNNIQYSEYLAEHVDNNIQFSDYIAEHVDNNIAYSEYIAENLSDTQAYSKYIAESLDKTIDSINGDEAVNEEVEAEEQRISDMKVANVDKFYAEEGDEFPPTDDQDLPEELNDIEDEVEDELEDELEDGLEDGLEDELGTEVEVSLDDEDETEEVQELPVDQGIAPGKEVIVDVDGEEKPGTVVSFNSEDGFAIVKLDQVEEIQDEEVQDDEAIELPEGEVDMVELPAEEGEMEEEEFVQPVQMEIEVHESKITIVAEPVNESEEVVEESVEETEETETEEVIEEVIEEAVEETEEVVIESLDPIFEQEKSIKDTISQLITEAKKRKASEEHEPHFLLFLTENNKEIWGKLSMEDKEKVNVAINESTYTSEQDVLNIIRESLSTPSKSEEETLIDAIPEDLISVWNGLNDTIKQSVLSQAKFYPNLVGSTPKMESFWNSRDLEQYSDNPSKVLLNENKNVVNDSKLSDNQIDKFISAFKNL